MNRQDFIRKVKENVSGTLEGVTIKDTTVFVDGVIEELKKAMVAGEEVSFSGFGKFTTSVRAAHPGRNPKTGEKIMIPETRVPKFSALTGLKEAVKNA